MFGKTTPLSRPGPPSKAVISERLARSPLPQASLVGIGVFVFVEYFCFRSASAPCLYLLPLFFTVFFSSAVLSPLIIITFGFIQDFLYGYPYGFFSFLFLFLYIYFSFCKAHKNSVSLTFQTIVFFSGFVLKETLGWLVQFCAFQHSHFFANVFPGTATMIFYGIIATMKAFKNHRYR